MSTSTSTGGPSIRSQIKWLETKTVTWRDRLKCWVFGHKWFVTVEHRGGLIDSDSYECERCHLGKVKTVNR